MKDQYLKKHDIYYQFLNCLRGLAIIMVIIHHTGLHFKNLVNNSVANFLVVIGWTGVDIFFAISGFLITKILTNGNNIKDIKIFFIKRVFRIIPLYFLALISFFVSGYFFEDTNISMLWINALFLTGWMIPFFGLETVPYTITWSLSVEEFAYIFFGLAVALVRKNFTVILLALIVMSLILRWVLVSVDIFQVQDVYFFPLTRMDSIAFGGLVALNIIKNRRDGVHMVLVLMFFCVLYFWLYKYGQYNKNIAIFGYSALAFLSALIVAFAITLDRSNNIFIRILAFIGERSYFIYLFHVFVVGLFGLSGFSESISALGFWGLVGSIIIVTIVMAEVSWRLFELPLIQIGRKIAISS